MGNVRIRWIPTGLGAAALGALGGGAAAALELSLSDPGIALTALAASLLGGVSVHAVTLSRELRARTAQLREQAAALERSAELSEQRYQQLLEAKAEVDRKVEERTSDLRQATAQLAQALDEVRALDKAKSEFFSNVSHELRTPLTLLLAPLTDLRQKRPPPGGVDAAIDSMHRNAERLLRLINQLLDLAKIDAGQMRLQRNPCDLPALVKAIVQSFATAARARNVQLTVDAPPKSVPIAVDPGWIESAVVNLISNALKFVGEGGSVAVRVFDREGDVVVEVEDDGPGIPPAEVGRVFERFAQGSNRPPGSAGTGLGLAIVREAARLHGGDASVESSLGDGSRFRVRLPRAVPLGERGGQDGWHPMTPVSRVRRVPTETVAESASVPDELEGPRPDAPLALVVEDNLDLRALVANVLSSEYNVRTTAEAAEALRLAIDLRPDVIVSDVGLPGMDGLALTRALRREPSTRAIPVILVTAHGAPQQVLDGFSAGADDYLVKPFHGRELLARARAHVRLRRMSQELAHQERLAALGQLAASVAHQARNALTSLIGGLPAMKKRLDGSLDPKSREMFDVMLDSAERIERMTLDLLDLSRVDREPFGTFQPGSGLLASIRLVEASAPADVTIEHEVDADVTLVGRGGDLNHVFLNILDNAARAVGANGRIVVVARLEDDAYVVRIGDSGRGVDPKIAHRIFDPFFTSRRHGEGTGLGLAIARRIIEQHGGTITVGASDLGGALFTVRLPCSSQPAAVVA